MRRYHNSLARWSFFVLKGEGKKAETYTLFLYLCLPTSDGLANRCSQYDTHPLNSDPRAAAIFLYVLLRSQQATAISMPRWVLILNFLSVYTTSLFSPCFVGSLSSEHSPHTASA